jgi:hypothetical protein
VERNEADLAYIAELHDALAAEAVTAIDFDRLRLWLQELAGALPELFRAREESRLLRDDFTDRISGMLKAIAVAEPGQKPISIGNHRPPGDFRRGRSDRLLPAHLGAFSGHVSNQLWADCRAARSVAAGWGKIQTRLN